MWAFGVHKATSLLKVPVFWQLRVVRACLALGGGTEEWRLNGLG